MPSYPHPETLTELSTARPGAPVVSVYLDTDPRKPENNSDNPAWLVELRNSLREVGAAIDAEGDRDTVLAWRAAERQIEEDVRDLTPAQRGRSVALFCTLDGSFRERITSQLTLDASQAVGTSGRGSRRSSTWSTEGALWRSSCWTPTR